jgi:HEAT repeat protein
MMQINALIADLFSSDEAVQQRAAQSLLQIGEPSIQPLLEAITRNDTSEEAIGYENRLLRDVFVQLGEPAFQATIDALYTHPKKRAIVKTMTLFKDRRAVPILLEFVIQCTNNSARYYAIDALGYFKDPRAFEPLLRLLESDNLMVVGDAARALGEYRDARALGPLKKALDAAQYQWLRERIEDAIRSIDDPTYNSAYRGFFIHVASILGL